MTDKKQWADMSPDEKREERFARWLFATDIAFSSLGAKEAYQARVMRFIKAIKLEEPDRVPVILPSSFFPAFYAGSTLKTVMNDYDELKKAWLKFLNEFEMDMFSGPAFVYPGKVFEILDYKLQIWPGHGLPDNAGSYQYIEGEYMFPEEYDALIRDPIDFVLRTHLPRCNGAFRGFSKLGPIPLIEGNPVFYLTQFAVPEVRESVIALLNAAQESGKWFAAVSDVTRAAHEAGIPSFYGGRSRAPFDFLGDTLRGTKGIMTDMYRRPEKLIEAMERVTPIIIQRSVAAVSASGSPVVLFTLHKGPGGFMSNKQFEKFYWPTFRKVMMGLIEEGLVPLAFAEGDYMPRLEIIKDMPKGKVIWHFEAVDMAKAKAVVGKNACIAGNIPTSILYTGSPAQVKEFCRSLIETCAPGGGYILAGAASIDNGNPDNLRVIMNAAKEYGVYKSQ